jgi:hypothetical protein
MPTRSTKIKHKNMSHAAMNKTKPLRVEPTERGSLKRPTAQKPILQLVEVPNDSARAQPSNIAVLDDETIAYLSSSIPSSSSSSSSSVNQSTLSAAHSTQPDTHSTQRPSTQRPSSTPLSTQPESLSNEHSPRSSLANQAHLDSSPQLFTRPSLADQAHLDNSPHLISLKSREILPSFSAFENHEASRTSINPRAFSSFSSSSFRSPIPKTILVQIR